METTKTLNEILTASGLPIETLDDGTVLPDLSGDEPDTNSDATLADIVAGNGDGWSNCDWGGKTLGGCWIERDSLTPYRGWEMTGGIYPDADYFRREFGLALEDDQANDLRQRVERASRREVRCVLDDLKAV